MTQAVKAKLHRAIESSGIGTVLATLAGAWVLAVSGTIITLMIAASTMSWKLDNLASLPSQVTSLITEISNTNSAINCVVLPRLGVDPGSKKCLKGISIQ